MSTLIIVSVILIALTLGFSLYARYTAIDDDKVVQTVLCIVLAIVTGFVALCFIIQTCIAACERYGTKQHIVCVDSAGKTTLDVVSAGDIFNGTGYFYYVDSSGREVTVYNQRCTITTITAQ